MSARHVAEQFAPSIGTPGCSNGWNFDQPEVRHLKPWRKLMWCIAVVSKRFQVVQPREILEFYRDLTQVSGFALETAGVLKGGKKFWALAKTGQSALLKGNDRVNGYLCWRRCRFEPCAGFAGSRLSRAEIQG